MLYFILAIFALIADVFINKFWLSKSRFKYKTHIANIIRIIATLTFAYLFKLPLGLRGIEGGLLAFILGIIIFIMSYFSIKAAFSEDIAHEYIPLDNLLVGSFWQMFFLLGFFVPIGEEMFFRGLVQNLFAKAVGEIWAIVFSILAFVGIHYNNVLSGFETKEQFKKMFPGRLLITAILCWLYYESKSIWLPVFIHALQDLGTYLIVYRYNKKTGSHRLPESFGEENSRTDI